MVGVPCKRGEAFTGLQDFAGIKNKRVRLLGDELSLLPRAFCDAISNLDKNPDFKCIGLGNPKETTDALGVLGEPAPQLGGWDGGIDQQFGTKTWPIRREQGIAIQLPGDDSPNLDGQLGIPLISQADMNRDISFYGKESLWYTMMNLGKMPKGQGSRRVLTRQLCLKYNTMDEPVWRDNNIRKIAFMDAAYRGVGGDRCVFGILEFGYEVPMEKFSMPDSAIAHSLAHNSANRQILSLKEMVIVPIDPGLDEPAEYQIATFCMKRCEENGIPPEDFFYDAGMRTSLCSAFSKVWGSVGETIDFGGSPTDEPVSSSISISCKDYYSKFVSQLWFSVRLAVEAGQIRNFTEDVIMEFSSREYGKVGNNKIEVEPKEKVKEKCGRSPDCFVAGTKILTPTGIVPIESIRTGDIVSTPFGSSPVVAVHESEAQACLVRFSDGSNLCGKGAHKIFTHNRGWCAISDLLLTDTIETCKTLHVWHLLNTFFTKDTRFGFKALVDIIKTETTTGLRANDFYTELSGLRNTDLFLKILASITKITIGETIKLATSKLCHAGNTLLTTCEFALRILSLESKTKSIWQKLSPLLRLGIRPRLELCGIQNTDTIALAQSLKKELTSAFSANKSSRLQPFNPSLNSAQSDAPTEITGERRSLIKTAWCAARCLLLTSTPERRTAPIAAPLNLGGRCAKVYNLTLLEHNAYYANGILVQNCADAFACGLHGAIKRGFRIASLKPPPKQSRQPDWRSSLRTRAKKLWSSGQLEHAEA